MKKLWFLVIVITISSLSALAEIELEINKTEFFDPLFDLIEETQVVETINSSGDEAQLDYFFDLEFDPSNTFDLKLMFDWQYGGLISLQGTVTFYLSGNIILEWTENEGYELKLEVIDAYTTEDDIEGDDVGDDILLWMIDWFTQIDFVDKFETPVDEVILNMSVGYVIPDYLIENLGEPSLTVESDALILTFTLEDPESLDIRNQVVTTTRDYSAVETIELAKGYSMLFVESEGDLSITAGSSITLYEGFHAKAGSEFQASIDEGMRSRANDLQLAKSLMVSRNDVVTARSTNQEEEEDEEETFEETEIEENELVNLPELLSCSNHPNPFNPETQIELALPQNSKVSITIFNSRGQKIKTLINRDLSAGYHSFSWSGDDNFGKLVSSGIYFYRVTTEKKSVLNKMLLLK